MADSPVQLRDSVRKLRKRVASVVRRGSSSKNIKSRTNSEDTDKHSHDSDHDHDSEHSHSHTNSAASSTHSLHKSAGSRSASPQPPLGGLFASPSGGRSRRLSITGLGFPRSPSKKNKSKENKSKEDKSKVESVPSSPPMRTRTVSTPGGTSPIEPSGKLTVPIPVRPRTLSHPLAASPILPGSPDKDKDNVAPKKPSHERAASAPGASGILAFASTALTRAVTATPRSEGASSSKFPARASSPPAVVLTPPVDSKLPASPPEIATSPPTSQPTPVPDVIAAPTPDVFSAPTPKTEEPGHPRDSAAAERDQAREGSGHSREPASREHDPGVKRTASTIGSDMGWSMLEPTQEEDEPEDESVGRKVEQVNKGGDKKDVKGKGKEVEPKIEEKGAAVLEPNKGEVVKIEKDDVEGRAPENRNSLLLDPVPPSSSGRRPLSASETEGGELLDGALVMSPEGSVENMPAQQAAPEPASDLATSGVFVNTPPRETHPTWVSSVSTPPRTVSPRPYSGFATPERPVTPPARLFSPERDGGAFSTPDNRKLRSSVTPGSTQFTDTPSRFSGIETPPRPIESGDDIPPPASISDSFFHPRNVERLNPRHFERSMSTMGVYGDADPDTTSVQEKLKRATAGPRPSLDTSIHEMISPSVRGEENELRKLAGTELRDWYEGETRTPKTVRMMLPETEHFAAGNGSGSKSRSALSQQALEPAAEIREPAAQQANTTEAQDQAEQTQPASGQTQVQPRPSTSQSQVQRQPDRAGVYTSVLSRLMSHMDRRSSLMARLATRLGTLGGVGGPLPPVERHPREWVAHTLPSGKVYYAHRLIKNDLDDIDDTTDTQPGSAVARTGAAAPAEGSSKVLIIPTPSASQPVTLVTDLDMSDPVTHSAVNSFVDKNLHERDVDLPSGWEIWIHVSGTGESPLDGSKAERWDEVSEAGSEPVDLGYGAPYVLVWTYVSHKRRRVGPQGPEDKFVVGEDAELDLEMERRYWAYVETHPAHADVNPRAVQEAIELLTWHYTDRLLAGEKRGEKQYIHVKPPFTPEESHEALEFLKSVSADYSHANAIMKTRTVARVHVRTAEWRLAKLHAVADAVNLEVMSPSERLRRRRAAANPFVGFPLRTLASLLGLGIPYLYVDQLEEKVEDRQRLMVADASTNLMSALLLGASVSFLAIPDLEDIARLAGVAAAACSLGSLAAGIVRLRVPSFSSGKGGEGTEQEQEPRPSALRTFARSLPLVLSAYAGSALVAGLAAYSWRGQVSTVDNPFTGLYSHDSWGQNSAGSRWLGSVMRGDRGSGYGFGGVGPESSRQGWAETSSQGLVRLWGVW